MVTNDYEGKAFTMESFTSQTTDASGNVDLTLQEIPDDDSSIYIFCGTKGYIASFDSRSDKVLTILVKKLKYDKLDNPLTGNLSNLPTNVTESTSKVSTDIGATDPFWAISGPGKPTGPHVHGISYISRHNHTVTFTSTDIPIAGEQADLTITVVYAWTHSE